MESQKLSKGQLQVAATGFLSLFSLVGIMFYGLPFFYDFWVKEFGWTRETVTSGNFVAKIIIGPIFGFIAGWVIDKFGPRRLMLSGIVMGGIALIGLSMMTSLWQLYFFYMFNALGYMCGGTATKPGANFAMVRQGKGQSDGNCLSRYWRGGYACASGCAVA
jgi:MFS family permease